MGFEGEHFGWSPRGIETRVEGLPRLRAVLDRLLIPGAGVTELERILQLESQRDNHSQLRYLLTSGLAVELITGFEREHHDLDLVIMDPDNEDYWEIYGTDNVTPGQYWADMRFDPQYLDQTARMAFTRINKGMPVETVHPGILMVQKSSDAFYRPPRQKDTSDVEALIEYWKDKDPNPMRWHPVIQTAINALPQRQQKVTYGRLRSMVGRN